MIVVVGGSGQLGSAFRQILPPDSVFLSSAHLDLRDVDVVRRVLEPLHPAMILNCAAYNDLDRAESEPDEAFAVNALGAEALALEAARLGAGFVTYSTDSVFDGRREDPYLEADQPNPLSVYGRSKAAAEELVAAAHPGALIIRTSWVLSGQGPNFASRMLDLDPTHRARVVDDQYGHPTIALDLAAATLAAVDRAASEILHLANQGTVNRFGLAREIYEIAARDAAHVRPCSTAEYGAAAFRPANGVLESTRLAELGLDPLPHYRPGLDRAVAGLQAAG